MRRLAEVFAAAQPRLVLFRYHLCGEAVHEPRVFRSRAPSARRLQVLVNRFNKKRDGLAYRRVAWRLWRGTRVC